MKLGWTRQAALLLLTATIFNSLVLLSFNLSIGRTYTTIAAALTSLYSTVAVLRERLTLPQWAGIKVIIGDVLIVNDPKSELG
ncbi:MAG: hypothetical protein H0U76_30950 [Ktedonobacteraceae bacterium]|nr:hypothetical protein [Ktedonobacteraceae bacterium]